MTLSRKINFMVSAIVAAFVILIGFFIFNTIITGRFMQTQMGLGELDAHFDDLDSQAKNLIIDEGGLTKSIDALLKAQADVKQQISIMEADPVLKTGKIHDVYVEIVKQFQGSSAAWDSIISDLKVFLAESDTAFSVIPQDSLMNMRLATAGSIQDSAMASLCGRIMANISSFEGAITAPMAQLRVDLGNEGNAIWVSSLITVIIASILIAGLSLLVSFSFIRRLSSRLHGLEVIMVAAAGRDIRLRAQDKVKDEISALGRNLNAMLDNLGEFLGEARATGKSMAGLNSALAASSTQSTAALHEISSNIQSITTQVGNLNGISTKSSQEVTQLRLGINGLGNDIGRQSVIVSESSVNANAITERIDGMYAITRERGEAAEDLVRITTEGGEKLESTHQLIDAVTADIDSVVEIIDLINHIAEQTNILSLNAAIESAHAGEAGKGFAIVAQEIQKLAESTGENSARISDSLRAMTDKIQDARQTSDYSKEIYSQIQDEIQAFAESFSSLNEQMNELSGASTQISRVITELAGISDTVGQRAASMNTGVVAIDGVARQSAEFSGMIVQGVQEIEVGAREVLSAMTVLQKMAQDNNGQVKHLGDFLDSYQLEKK